MMNENLTLIRALTWNIHGCIGLDGRHQVERTGQVIARISPDIVALQEVDLRRKSRTQADILSYLRGQIGDHSHEAWALTEKEGNYGQVLLSRYPLIARHVHDISLPGYEPRKILDAVVEMPDNNLRVIAAHLGFWPHEKKHQIEILCEIVRSESSLPLVMLGDLNLWSMGSVKKILKDISGSCSSHKTYPSPIPVLALDRILCKGGAQILESSAVRDAWWVSDHLPVLANIKINKD